LFLAGSGISPVEAAHSNAVKMPTLIQFKRIDFVHRRDLGSLVANRIHGAWINPGLRLHHRDPRHGSRIVTPGLVTLRLASLNLRYLAAFNPKLNDSLWAVSRLSEHVGRTQQS
jgi:hypothetical protein